MRIAIIADIHGNLPALEAVLADIQRRRIDRTINLGDSVSGPLWPREVCDLLMASSSLVIRGNHDRWVSVPIRQVWDRRIDTPTPNLVQITDTGLEHCRTRPMLGMASSPVTARPRMTTSILSRRYRNTTGASTSVDDQERLARCQARVVLCGHSHQPCGASDQLIMPIQHPADRLQQFVSRYRSR